MTKRQIKMKNHCLITVMSTDDKKFVTGLAAELEKEFEVVSLLALGSEQEINYLKSQYENVHLAEELGYSFRADQLVVLSLESIFEIDGLFLKFERVSFWTDPNLKIGTEEKNMIASVLAYGLSNSAMGAVSSRTEEGSDSWKQYSNLDAEYLPTLFKPTAQHEDVEPLIEKSGATRIMIDSGENISNYFMVEAFIALQSMNNGCQTWCVYDGELKPWMKPDYQIGSIPESELAMYVNSVDGVVLTGTLFQQSTISNYLSLGVLPIVIDEKVVEEIEKTINTALIKEEFSTFGTVQLLKDLSASPDELRRYNNLATRVSREEVFFSSESLKERSVSTETVVSILKSKQHRCAREEYLQLKYGDKQGSTLHKEILRNSSILCEFSGYEALQITLSGWGVHKTNATICSPLVFCGNTNNDILLRRSNRHDVAEYFGLHTVENIGFHGRFVVDKAQFNTNDLSYAVKISDDLCTNINTIVEGLDVSCTEERAKSCGFELELDSEWGGCIETFIPSDVVAFDLHEIRGDITKCDIRFKNSTGYLANNGLDVYAEVDDVLVKVLPSVHDEFSLSVHYSYVEDCSVRVFVNVADYEGDDLVCVVSSEDTSVRYKKVPHLKVVSNNIAETNPTAESADSADPDANAAKAADGDAAAA